MQSILIAYTLAVLSQTGLASYVTVDYWHSTDCSGDSTSLEINGDSCHTGNINAQSYKLTWADIITPNSKLTWYSDGDACIGTSTYTQTFIGYGYSSENQECQTTGGDGSVGLFIMG